MAIGLRASGSATLDVNTASQTVTIPAGAAAGDVMILAIGLNMLSPSTTLTGWVLVGSFSQAGASTVVFQRVVQAGDSTWSYTPGGGAEQMGFALQTFTGVDTTTPIDATGTASGNASTTTISAGAVTVATDQAWHLIGVGSAQGGGSATSFTALTNGTISNEGGALLYNQTPKSTGSTGAVTVTTVTGAKSVVPFALRPAVSAATDTKFGPRAFNLQVGPVALRFGKRSTLPVDLTQAPVTDTNFGSRVRVPNNRVGPMALRQLYRSPAYPFDTTAASTGNRLRRVIISGA